MSEGSNGHNRDDGIERHTRRHPCIKRTWCVLELEHDGPCVEKPRAPIAYPIVSKIREGE